MSSDDILTITLANDIKSLVQPRVFVTLLQMCTVLSGSVRGMLSCNDPAFWEQIHLHLSQTLWTDPAIPAVASVVLSTNGQNASRVNTYKRKCIELVTYRILDGKTGMPPTAMFIDGPMSIFLARKNGSIKSVTDGLRAWFQKVRERDPNFPPVPAHFAIALLEGVKRMVLHWRGNAKSNGLANFPALLDAVGRGYY